LQIIKCTSHSENILKSVIYTPIQIVDIVCVSKCIYRIQQLRYKINLYEFTFDIRVLQRTQRDKLLKSSMIFCPPQIAANTNLCYNANCFTVCTTPLLNSLELPEGTIKENRANFVVHAERFPAVIFLHRVNLEEKNQSLKKKYLSRPCRTNK